MCLAEFTHHFLNVLVTMGHRSVDDVSCMRQNRLNIVGGLPREDEYRALASVEGDPEVGEVLARDPVPHVSGSASNS